MTKAYFLFVFFSLLTISPACFAQDAVRFNYQEFIAQAGSGNMMEVRLGEMAQTKAASQEVRNFAEKMVEQHAKMQGDLKQIVEGQGYTFPATMMEEYQNKVERLAGYHGSRFDEAYMDTMLEAHRKAVQLFESAAAQSDIQALQTFAQNKLDMLGKHLQMARQLEQEIDTEGD
jgi:putative membrane protein